MKATRGPIRLTHGSAWVGLYVGTWYAGLVLTWCWLWWPREWFAVWAWKGPAPIVRVGPVVVTRWPA